MSHYISNCVTSFLNVMEESTPYLFFTSRLFTSSVFTTYLFYLMFFLPHILFTFMFFILHPHSLHLRFSSDPPPPSLPRPFSPHQHPSHPSHPCSDISIIYFLLVSHSHSHSFGFTNNRVSIYYTSDTSECFTAKSVNN